MQCTKNKSRKTLRSERQTPTEEEMPNAILAKCRQEAGISQYSGQNQRMNIRNKNTLIYHIL